MNEQKIICQECKEKLDEDRTFSDDVKSKICNFERQAYLLDKHVIGF